MFSLTGHIDGHPAVLTWTDGEWGGDARAAQAAAALVAVGEDVDIPGVVTATAASEPAIVALATAWAAFDPEPRATFAGNEPTADPIPDGAVP